MPEVFIPPQKLKGTLKAPPSKSEAHRAVICAALAGDENIEAYCDENISDDIKTTCSAVKGLLKGEKEIFCRESGSTLRFLIPVAAALGREIVFKGSGRLPERPLKEYADVFKDKGVSLDFEGEKFLPAVVKGRLEPGIFHVPGDVSSQYITGLLFALPLLREDSEIRIINELESSAYVDLTVYVMKHFGVEIQKREKGFFVPGNQKYTKSEYEVEGDYSQAAFWMTANYLGNEIEITGLNPLSLQGDKKITEILDEYEGFKTGPKLRDKTYAGELFVEITGKQEQKAFFEIDASEIPDLVPTVCVAAANTNAVTRIVNAKRLRYKESDRIKTTCELVKSIGGTAFEMEEGILINGTDKPLKGGIVDSFGDHRIAMAAAIAAPSTRKGVTIKNHKCVDKSYPGFFEDLRKVGGQPDEFDDGK